MPATMLRSDWLERPAKREPEGPVYMLMTE